MSNTERKNIRLTFGNDLYSASNLDSIPYTKGIYMAFTGKYNGHYVDLNKLLYIGMADDTPIKDRLQDHIENHHSVWSDECDKGEEIYYRVAELTHDIRDTEAALIFTHKPLCNKNDKEKYNGSRPSPNVTTDTTLPDIKGFLTDFRSMI